MPSTEPSAFALPSRRDFLRNSALGFGSLALAHLFARDRLLADGSTGAPAGRQLDLRPRTAHVAPRAKAMILLFQNGGPSQMELFDHKPELARRDGQVYAEKVEVLQPGNSDKLMAGVYKFQRHGSCGMELSEKLPGLGSVADELCLVPVDAHTENNNHPQALRLFLTGERFFPAKPDAGGVGCVWPGDREPEPAGVRRASRSEGV